MPDFLLIAIVALVPIVALALALACGRAREAVRDAAAEVSSDTRPDDACS